MQVFCNFFERNFIPPFSFPIKYDKIESGIRKEGDFLDFLANDVLSGELSPVFLGYSANAGNSARRLFRRYRLISHVFCERVPFLRRFSLIMKFHIVSGFSRDELALIALENFADANRTSEAILYLIPATKAARDLIARHRERLETRFVIASQSDIRKLYEIPPISS